MLEINDVVSQKKEGMEGWRDGGMEGWSGRGLNGDMKGDM